jgi:hypothetical protein
MAAQRVLTGVVRGGVIVPEASGNLPEGAQVRILLQEDMSVDLPPDFQKWDALGRDAWSLLDEWEREENVEPW